MGGVLPQEEPGRECLLREGREKTIRKKIKTAYIVQRLDD
nr:MAG TPA: hypothetical protein [Caudoviricetes sp.]